MLHPATLITGFMDAVHLSLVVIAQECLFCTSILFIQLGYFRGIFVLLSYESHISYPSAHCRMPTNRNVCACMHTPLTRRGAINPPPFQRTPSQEHNRNPPVVFTPEQVYLTSAAPPVRHPNVYGIDIPTQTELVAYNRTPEQVQFSCIVPFWGTLLGYSTNPPVSVQSTRTGVLCL